VSASPPALSGGLPFLGHAIEFRHDPVRLLQRGRDRLGPVFSFVLAGQRVAALTGAEANEAFFSASDAQLSAREAYQFTVPIFGKGIVYDSSPEQMDEQLGLVFPALREARLRAYVDAIVDEVETYIASWGDAGELELLDTTNELTVFIASRCLIGQEFRRSLSGEFARLYHDLEGGINLLAFFVPHLPLPSFRRRDRARVRMVELLAPIMRERRARGTEHEDFLQTLMSARLSDGRVLSDDHITGLLLTLIFAGQHTSAVLAAWTGIELLRHPRSLAAVAAEQAAILEGGAPLAIEDVRRMVELERAVRECERMHPPLIMLMRKVVGDFAHAGYRVPAGWLALVSPAVSHRIPAIFADPDRYDPDRYGPGREEDRKAKYALIGFGGGRHRCIGTTFAYLQIVTLWSILLRHFEFELVRTDVEPNYRTFVVGPQPPCRVRYRRRRRPLVAVGDGAGRTPRWTS
jgi:sterol 14-demethylase